MKTEYLKPISLITSIFTVYYVLVYFWLSNNQFNGISNFYDVLYFLNLFMFLYPVTFFAYQSVIFVLKIHIYCNPCNIKNFYQFFWCLEVLEFEDKYDLKHDDTYEIIMKSDLLINHLKSNNKSEPFSILTA